MKYIRQYIVNYNLLHQIYHSKIVKKFINKISKKLLQFTSKYGRINYKLKQENKSTKIGGQNMTTYKAFVKDKTTGRYTTIESEYETKSDFIKDLRGNGYAVNPLKVKTVEIFDYIVNRTDMNPWDWKITALPN